LGAEVATIFENGRLTDEDVIRYTRRLGITDRLTDAMQSAIDGTITKEKARLIRETLTKYANKTQQELRERADEKAKVFQQRSVGNYKLKDVSQLVYGNYGDKNAPVKKPPAPGTVEQVDKKTGKTAIYQKGTNKFLGWKE
jgi:hypothetical protein